MYVHLVASMLAYHVCSFGSQHASLPCIHVVASTLACHSQHGSFGSQRSSLPCIHVVASTLACHVCSCGSQHAGLPCGFIWWPARWFTIAMCVHLFGGQHSGYQVASTLVIHESRYLLCVCVYFEFASNQCTSPLLSDEGWSVLVVASCIGQ